MRLRSSHICSTQPPWLVRTATNTSNVALTVNTVCAEVHLAELRGERMRTIEELYMQFSQSFNFPDYFGFNGAAFEECMTDLEWLPAPGYVVLVANSGAILEGRHDDIAWVIDAFNRICEEWARPIALGEAWDRPAIPFHVIFQHDGTKELLPPLISNLPEWTD